MFVQYLNEELRRRKERNKRYSIRSFSYFLQIDPSTLARILRRDRPLTVKTAEHLLKKLKLDTKTKKELLLSLHTPLPEREPYEEKVRVFQGESAEIFDRWEIFSVLSFLEIRNIPRSVDDLALLLGIDKGRIKKAVSVLLETGLVKEAEAGLELVGVATSLAPSKRSDLLKRLHLQYVDRARYSLENHHAAETQFSGMTMAISKAKLPEALIRIRDFRRSLASFLCGEEVENVDDVYRLNIQLFPLRK